MATYDCKKQGCPGKVSFPDTKKDTHPKPSKGGLDLTRIREIPQECSQCHTSYLEYEFGNEAHR